MKWIVLLLFLACCGCATQRTKITLTRIDGQPALSIEFEERNRQHVTYRDDASTACPSNVLFRCFK